LLIIVNKPRFRGFMLTDRLKIRLVCATLKSQEAFLAESALGQSRWLWSLPNVEMRLFCHNTGPLPCIYNMAIEEVRGDGVILVFIHDDLTLADIFWVERLREALGFFDVVGLAGNRRRVPRQPAWIFLDDQWTRDDPVNLSGRVAHGSFSKPLELSCFGPALQETKLLDGLFLAVNSRTLESSGLRFDERFSFHFYDLDFCREAEIRGLKMGTGQISALHESAGGGYGSPGWRQGYEAYLAKWGE
jgi:hypothetical protein